MTRPSGPRAAPAAALAAAAVPAFLAALALVLLAAGPARAAEVRVPAQLGSVRLDDARGIVHVVFVARWCGPCEAEIHALRRAAPALPRGSYQLVLVGVSLRETGQEFDDWVRGLGVEAARVYDGDGGLERALGVTALPYHVVIGPGRRLLASGDRAPSPAQLQRWAAEATSAAPALDNGSR